MTLIDAQLHDAILDDPTARTHADAGNESGVAARVAAIQPSVPMPIPMSSILIRAAGR